MNGQLPSNIFTYPKINYRCPILFGEGNKEVPEQKTVRVYGVKLFNPEEKQSLLPTLRAEPAVFRKHHTRFSPYKRSTETKLEEPIIITKKTTITVNRAPSIFNRAFYEQVLAAVNGETIFVKDEEIKKETPTIKVKEEEEDKN